MTGNSDLVDLSGIKLGETEKAIKVRFYGTPGEDYKDVWLPKSQIEEEPMQTKDGVTITMPQWLAEEKGIV